ncbi:MAG: hypothetical protein EZS28_009425 [Streblomastix strix]|uniref:Uncharacterized protein n=1 Tax=Streblomastix strix TaxID=222440 RepID=A0A5J4WL55_9EUKA|nr:MAG: hypothetical protein EZS28_009425 [Streblomastix strix]
MTFSINKQLKKLDQVDIECEKMRIQGTEAVARLFSAFTTQFVAHVLDGVVCELEKEFQWFDDGDQTKQFMKDPASEHRDTKFLRTLSWLMSNSFPNEWPENFVEQCWEFILHDLFPSNAVSTERYRWIFFFIRESTICRGLVSIFADLQFQVEQMEKQEFNKEVNAPALFVPQSQLKKKGQIGDDENNYRMTVVNRLILSFILNTSDNQIGFERFLPALRCVKASVWMMFSSIVMALEAIGAYCEVLVRNYRGEDDDVEEEESEEEDEDYEKDDVDDENDEEEDDEEKIIGQQKKKNVNDKKKQSEKSKKINNQQKTKEKIVPKTRIRRKQTVKQPTCAELALQTSSSLSYLSSLTFLFDLIQQAVNSKQSYVNIQSKMPKQSSSSQSQSQPSRSTPIQLAHINILNIIKQSLLILHSLTQKNKKAMADSVLKLIHAEIVNCEQNKAKNKKVSQEKSNTKSSSQSQAQNSPFWFVKLVLRIFLSPQITERGKDWKDEQTRHFFASSLCSSNALRFFQRKVHLPLLAQALASSALHDPSANVRKLALVLLGSLPVSAKGRLALLSLRVLDSNANVRRTALQQLTVLAPHISWDDEKTGDSIFTLEWLQKLFVANIVAKSTIPTQKELALFLKAILTQWSGKQVPIIQNNITSNQNQKELENGMNIQIKEEEEDVETQMQSQDDSFTSYPSQEPYSQFQPLQTQHHNPSDPHSSQSSSSNQITQYRLDKRPSLLIKILNMSSSFGLFQRELRTIIGEVMCAEEANIQEEEDEERRKKKEQQKIAQFEREMIQSGIDDGRERKNINQINFMGMNRFDRRFGEKERILDRYIDYE